MYTQKLNYFSCS